MKRSQHNLADFQRFAESRGCKPIDNKVSFDTDKAKADQFAVECEAEGFDVVTDSNRAGSYRGAEDLSQMPEYWFVRFDDAA